MDFQEKKDEALRKKQVKKAAIASIVGTSIEWYDFFLYGTMAALVFPKLFFPESDSYIGVLQAFTTLFIGFLARPIGAMIFGNYGDRIGRKATLVITLLLMGISSTLIGLLPTYENIGIWASVFLVLLRFIQGIGVGGEWGGSVVLSIEWSSKKHRGLMGSMTQLGVPIGLLVSTCVVSICIFFTGDSFESWGWRIPFLISILLVGVGLFIRLGIKESPQFSKMKEENLVAKRPVLEVIKEHPKTIMLAAFSRLSEQVPFYLFTTFVISYGTEQINLDKQFLTNTVLLVSVAYLFVVPLSAYLSDKFGRKKMYFIGSSITLLFAFPYFYLLNTGVSSLIVLAIAISGIGPGMVYGPQAAMIAENFPLHLRYSGSSLAYQLASIIGGGIAPMISLFLLHEFGSTIPISLYIIICCVIAIVSVSQFKGAGQAKEDNHDIKQTI
ncbi:MFS transporter [Priestia megaterium]|uniref:MFS transporter n=1 Tax=Priestia megaterium TaxID=1404 RepID=UPI002E1CAA61|nr:MFS transporter [Priestia megaterium]MED4298547.1 MFS transporter [Priestia megaterium]